MTKCINPHCDQQADSDVGSQGYCLRCVMMWISGIDPQIMLRRAARLAAFPVAVDALQQIVTIIDDRDGYDPELWNDLAHYRGHVLNSVKLLAKDCLRTIERIQNGL